MTDVRRAGEGQEWGRGGEARDDPPPPGPRALPSLPFLAQPIPIEPLDGLMRPLGGG
jgi:hypothetical protein